MGRLFLPICAGGGALLAVCVAYLTSDRSASGAAVGAPVMIAGVQGAPGDGNAALQTAFSVILENARILEVEELTGCAVAVSAEVSKQRTGETDQISIVWQVHDVAGRFLGEVAQLNEVPAGKLDRSWGTDASLAARGAHDRIVDIVRRRHAGCA